MGFKLFGFQIGRQGDELKKLAEKIPSFVAPENYDGAIELPVGGSTGLSINLDALAKTEVDLINKYRDLSLQPEVETVVDDIVNEAIVVDKEAEAVGINLEDVNQPDEIKAKIEEEFCTVLKLLNFQNLSHDIFRRWYIDGRMYYHIMIDTARPRDGIKELRFVDPRRMRKVREPIMDAPTQIVTPNHPEDAAQPAYQEYYYYKPQLLPNPAEQGMVQHGELRVAADSVCYVHSGLLDQRNQLVLSYLHKAIKPMNQLRTMEDAVVIYRLARAPERRVFYVDVGNLPKMKAEQYLQEVMTRNKNRLVYDAQSGEIRDDRKFMCYTLDTKIPLLDGRTVSLQEIIAEYQAGKSNWVYSCDSATGKFAPGPVSWAGVTKKNASVVKVTFDNGKHIICTPDHKFPVWGKGLIEAKDLVGESVIPGYRRKKSIVSGAPEYEQIYQNDTKTWVFTHREIAKWKEENCLREEMVYNQKFLSAEKNTIHHKNYNKFDNSPNNLLMMNRHDHIEYHANCARGNFKPNKSEDFTLEWRRALSLAAKQRIPSCKTWKITNPIGENIIIENLSKFCREHSLNRCNIKSQFGSRGFHAEQLHNHKAVSVEWLSNTMDVGCLTVDLNETYHSYHTYLLDAGVYTKNTMLEDYYLARRGEGKGTEITHLQGGQNLGEMTDVEYFRKRLYKSLNVPISRIESEGQFNLGRASEITRDELKFAKFIQRLRHRFTHLFDNLLEIQLSLKGIMRREDWRQMRNEIKYDFLEDNFFSESKTSEIMGSRLETLSKMEGSVGTYYSRAWVRRHILQMTEDEIDQMEQEIEEEKAQEKEEQAAQGLENLGLGPDGTPLPVDPHAPPVPGQVPGHVPGQPQAGAPAAGPGPTDPKQAKKKKFPFKKRAGTGTRHDGDTPFKNNETSDEAIMTDAEKLLVENMAKAVEEASRFVLEDEL